MRISVSFILTVIAAIVVAHEHDTQQRGHLVARSFGKRQNSYAKQGGTYAKDSGYTKSHPVTPPEGSDITPVPTSSDSPSKVPLPPAGNGTVPPGLNNSTQSVPPTASNSSDIPAPPAPHESSVVPPHAKGSDSYAKPPCDEETHAAPAEKNTLPPSTAPAPASVPSSMNTSLPAAAIPPASNSSGPNAALPASTPPLNTSDTTSTSPTGTSGMSPSPAPANHSAVDSANYSAPDNHTEVPKKIDTYSKPSEAPCDEETHVKHSTSDSPQAPPALNSSASGPGNVSSVDSTSSPAGVPASNATAPVAALPASTPSNASGLATPPSMASSAMGPGSAPANVSAVDSTSTLPPRGNTTPLQNSSTLSSTNPVPPSPYSATSNNSVNGGASTPNPYGPTNNTPRPVSPNLSPNDSVNNSTMPGGSTYPQSSGRIPSQGGVSNYPTPHGGAPYNKGYNGSPYRGGVSSQGSANGFGNAGYGHIGEGQVVSAYSSILDQAREITQILSDHSIQPDIVSAKMLAFFSQFNSIVSSHGTHCGYCGDSSFELDQFQSIAIQISEIISVWLSIIQQRWSTSFLQVCPWFPQTGQTFSSFLQFCNSAGISHNVFTPMFSQGIVKQSVTTFWGSSVGHMF